VRASSAPKVYVNNVATQAGETDHFSALDHLAVIDNQLGPGVLDAVLVNSNTASADAIGPELAIDPVLPDSLDRLDAGIRVIARDVVSDQNPLRHDPEKLGAALLEIATAPWPAAMSAGDNERMRDGFTAPRPDLVATGGSRE
jgi:uncharacterized cofD-like protein